MFCRENSLLSTSEEAIVVKPLKCKCWTCPECRIERTGSLIAQAQAGRPTHFITLTVNPAFLDSPRARAKALARAFKELRRRAKREAKRKLHREPHPKGPRLDYWRAGTKNGVTPRQVRLIDGRFPFLAVFEKTKRGEPHLHIVARLGWIGQEWLSQQMRELIEAPVVDVQLIEDQSKVANYVAKYIGSDPTKFEGTKRYWQSPGWTDTKWQPKEYPIPEGSRFERVFESLASIVHRKLVAGWRRIEEIGPYTVVWKFPGADSA